MHRPNYLGLLDIFNTKCMLGLSRAAGGEGEHGAYFWGKRDGRWQSPDMEADTWRNHVVGAFEAAWYHRENVTGVIFECWAKTPWKRWKRSRPQDEQAQCAQGWSLHLGNERESRWCVPREHITIVAMWLVDSSLDTLDDYL